MTKTHHYLGYSGRSDFPEDCYYFKGRIRQVDRYASQGGALLTQTKYVWENVEDTTYHWAFVKLIQSRTEHYDSETVYIQKDYAYDDTNGNLLTAISSGTDAENIIKSYGYTNYGDWLWRKTQETMEGSSSGKVRETCFEYENNTGNLISKELWLDSDINPREEMTYDNNGNRISLTDARGNLTTTEYDTDTYTYPVRIIYPATGDVSHIEQFQYDYLYGKVSAEKDQNSNWTYYDFDPFGRIKQVDYPDGGQKIYEYYECNDPQCIDTIFPRYVIQKVKEDNSGSYIDKYTYFDGL
ncbi:MAG: hypothetical protein K8S13_14990, partial [Desulfobacula sp.]|uniref:hypothetical protein n=1 Tax=Desulfobacula sp. TaxID=2593537 RepID=UPI0025BE23D2